MIKNEIIEKNDYNSIFYYHEHFLNNKEIIYYLNYLNDMDDFYPCNNYKNIICRYQKWYQIKNKYFCNNWNKRYDRWRSFNYDNIILQIQNKIQKLLYDLNLITNLNSCLINKYTDGNNYISNHRDSILSFGEYPTICILSIGEPRMIKFNRIIHNNENKKSIKIDKNTNNHFDFFLKSGSIFIMSGSSQKYYVHEIPKSDSTNIRYSFTFRNYIL